MTGYSYSIENFDWQFLFKVQSQSAGHVGTLQLSLCLKVLRGEARSIFTGALQRPPRTHIPNAPPTDTKTFKLIFL